MRKDYGSSVDADCFGENLRSINRYEQLGDRSDSDGARRWEASLIVASFMGAVIDADEASQARLSSTVCGWPTVAAALSITLLSLSIQL